MRAQSSYINELRKLFAISMAGFLICTALSWFAATYAVPGFIKALEWIGMALAADPVGSLPAVIFVFSLMSIPFLPVFSVFAGTATFFGLSIVTFLKLMRSDVRNVSKNEWGQQWRTSMKEFTRRTSRTLATDDQKDNTAFVSMVQTKKGDAIRAESLFSASINQLPAQWYAVANSDAMILRITTPFTFPHMIIDSHIEQAISLIGSNYKNGAKLPLPADMGEYFTAWVAAKNEHIGLQLLTPDVLQAILFDIDGCDVELHDSYIDVVWPKLFTDKAFIEREKKLAPFVRQLQEQAIRCIVQPKESKRRLIKGDGVIAAVKDTVHAIYGILFVIGVAVALILYLGQFVFTMMPGGNENIVKTIFATLFVALITLPVLFAILYYEIKWILSIVILYVRAYRHVQYMRQKQKYLFYYAGYSNETA